MFGCSGFSCPDFVITCDELDSLGFRFNAHVCSIPALWPNKSVLRELNRAITRAICWNATQITVKVYGLDWAFQKAFNLFIGNGFRWNGDDTFTMALPEARNQ